MVESNTTKPNDSATTENSQSPPFFPAKRWEEMNNAEKVFYRQMPEETIRARWDTLQGQDVRAAIIAVNTCAGSKADYSSIVGTIKTSWGKREPPKTDLRGLNLSGYSKKPSTLIGLLEQSEMLTSVRFSSPVTLDQRLGLHRFNLAASVLGRGN